MRLKVCVLGVALLGLLGLGAWRVGPYIAHRLQTERAVSSLRGLRLPGLSGCGSQDLVNAAGTFCGQGSAAPAATAVALRDQLRLVGADDVIARCATVKVIGVACRVTGVVHGQRVLATLSAKSPATVSGAAPSGVFLAGGVGTAGIDIPDFLRHGTALPLPNETPSSARPRRMPGVETPENT